MYVTSIGSKKLTSLFLKSTESVNDINLERKLDNTKFLHTLSAFIFHDLENIVSCSFNECAHQK